MISSQASNQVIQRWQKIPHTYPEASLQTDLVIYALQVGLGLNFNQLKHTPALGTGAGLTPDILVYKAPTKPPVLVIENKKRVSALATAPDSNFVDLCKVHPLYQQAVGYRPNGIKQYLDNSNPKIDPNLLASYGLVFNGDFFQLWRRVDGLILPLTPIQRFTDVTIPKLLKQLDYCLNSPPKALVTAIWNRKGGVAKTTNTINLGSVLALEGKKVLLIDMDTQNDLTMALKLDPANYSQYLTQCIDEIQAGRPNNAKTILQSTIQTRKFPTTDKKSFELHILPGESKSQEDFRGNKNYDSRTKIKLFQKLVHLLVEDYDYIFIDVSPASDNLTRCTLFSCDTLLIPSDYSRKTLHHAVDLYHKDIPTIRTNRQQQNALHLGPWNLGIVFSNCPTGVTPTSRLEKYIQQELKVKGFISKQCQTRLAIYAQTKLAEFQHCPVICWQNSPITKLYKDLADEVFLNHHFIDD